MTDQMFRAIITVLDQASLPLRAINKEVAALSAPVRQFGSGLAEVAEHSGLSRLKEAAFEAGEKFHRLGESVLEVLGPLEMLAGGASIAGIVELTRSASEYGAQLYDAALKTGIAASELATLHFIAQQSHVDVEQLDKGAEKLNRTLGDAAAGKNKNAASMFRALGISIRDANGHVRDAAQVLPDLSEAIKINTDVTTRARIGATAFGGKIGSDLIPVLAKGRDGFEEMMNEAQRLGLVMSDKDVAAAKHFEDSWENLGFAVKGTANAIGTALFPVIEPLIEGMTDWLVVNRELIATNVRHFIVELGDALKQIDWEGIGSSVKSWAIWFRDTEVPIIHVNAGLALIAGIAFAPVIGGVISLTASIITLGVALAGVNFAAWGAGMLSAVAFMSDLTIAIRAGYAPMMALNLAMDANPIGAVIIAITALCVVLYELYEHWDKVKEAATDAMKAMSFLNTGRNEQEQDPVRQSSGGWWAGLGLGGAEQKPSLYGNSPMYYDHASEGMKYNSKVDLSVHFENAPAGMRVDSQSTGIGLGDLNLGYSFGGGS